MVSKGVPDFSASSWVIPTCANSGSVYVHQGISLRHLATDGTCPETSNRSVSGRVVLANALP